MSPEPAERSPCIRVLVVDDSHEFRSAVCAYLESLLHVHVVGEACDGDEATELAERLQPALVLMDVQMPRCNGLEATKRMRRSTARPHIVLFSLHASSMLHDAALAAGADEFCAKGDFVQHVSATLARFARHTNDTGDETSTHTQ